MLTTSSKSSGLKTFHGESNRSLPTAACTVEKKTNVDARIPIWVGTFQKVQLKRSITPSKKKNITCLPPPKKRTTKTKCHRSSSHYFGRPPLVFLDAMRPSRSQSKPANGIGNCWFHWCQASNHSAPLNEVSGWGASQPPMLIKCLVGSFFSRIFERTLATHSRSGMAPEILGWFSSFTRFKLNQKITLTPLSTACKVWDSLHAPQFCHAAMMFPSGKELGTAAQLCNRKMQQKLG